MLAEGTALAPSAPATEVNSYEAARRVPSFRTGSSAQGRSNSDTHARNLTSAVVFNEEQRREHSGQPATAAYTGLDQ